MAESGGNVNNEAFDNEHDELNAIFDSSAPIVFPYGFRIDEVDGEKRIVGLSVHEYRDVLAESRGVDSEAIDVSSLVPFSC